MKPGAGRTWLLVTLFVILGSQPAESGVGQYAIQFREHLKVSTDLRLAGTQASSSLRFFCESSWKATSGSTLHLFIDHSPNLDGNRSFLSVTLNYGILRSVRLDEHNQSITEITIPLPPEMLRPENEIIFSVEQFPTTPGSSETWASIKPSSFISINYEEEHPTLDLRQLPSPLVDVHSYRPKLLSVLLPVRPSPQTLEGTALVIANYAAKLGDALTVRTVHSIDALSGPLLIVGTPEEQPLWFLDNQLPFRLLRVGKETRLGQGRVPFDADAGVVALVARPGATFNPILIATGSSPLGVSKAVRKLIDNHFDSPGTFAKISQDVPPNPQPRREWKGFIPPDNHFTLDQMGVKELKFDSQNGFSVTLPVSATPDAEFLEYGNQLTLKFRFDSDAGIEHARLDVDWNGSNLGRFDAAAFSTGRGMSVHLKIPRRLIRQQNVLSMTWHELNGAGKDPAAWLLPTSDFDLPRDFRSNLPDLGLLQFGLFPFGLRSDLSDVVFMLPDDSSGEATAALFEFAGLLGRLVPASRFAFSVRRLNELSRETRDSSHIIAFRIDELPKGSPSRRAVAVIGENISPWNPDKSLLSITSGSAAALRGAIGTVFSEPMLKRLSGDTAHIYADGASSFKTVPVHQISEYSYSTHLQAWLRENWIALPLILTAASCLLFVGLRLALSQYKNRNQLRRSPAFDLTSSSGPRKPL
jgi:Bacterial cellulose synthase subunit